MSSEPKERPETETLESPAAEVASDSSAAREPVAPEPGTDTSPEAEQNPSPHPEPETTEPSVVEEELTPEQIQELKSKAAKADEHWERLLRLSADFDNFKKRAVRERQDAIRFANEALLEKLIPILDNFDMAVNSAQQSDNLESLRTGIEMIYNQYKTVMKDAGLEEIDASGQPFDPAWHEAVSQQESEEIAEGHVLQQLRKGYKLRDRLIRPATVVVAKKPAA